MSEITVIYDGRCQFCTNAISWISKKLTINPIDYHTAELAKYSLTAEQCSREVFVIYNQEIMGGAKAVAFLLKQRGNRFTSTFINALGPLSRFGYRWVASHRNSLLVKAISRFLK